MLMANHYPDYCSIEETRFNQKAFDLISLFCDILGKEPICICDKAQEINRDSIQQQKRSKTE